MKTNATKKKEITRAWHHVDAKGKVLGRLAVGIAQKLMGKQKAYFVRNLDCGDYVVVTNSQHIHVTGNKEQQKTYTRYSGYPGGLRKETLGELRTRKPNDIIYNAVYGMLPKNKLRSQMIKRLYIFPESTHTYTDKFTQQETK